MNLHLSAAIISNKQRFVNHILGNTVNGITFHGVLGRTTGTYSFDYFGAGNDPRACGAMTPEGVMYTWSCNREIIRDIGPPPKDWKLPAAT